MVLNPYTIKWALYIDKNNVFDSSKSFHAPNQESLNQKLIGKKGRFFIVTDKQFGLIQNSWAKNQVLKPNTKLSIHLQVETNTGAISLVPMTQKQFNNPIIL